MAITKKSVFLNLRAGYMDMQLYVEEGLIRRQAFLSEKQIKQLQAQAVNRTARKMSKDTAKFLSERYVQPMVFFRRFIHMYRADGRAKHITAWLNISGPPSVPIEAYPVRVVKRTTLKKKGGVYVRILRGEPALHIENSFYTDWKNHYYKRKTSARLPIARLGASSGLPFLHFELVKGLRGEALKANVTNFLRNELDRQIDNKLQKLAQRMAKK